MDTKALFSLTYGLYVVASRQGEKFNAQMANTVFQISNDPPTVAVSINKNNLTHDYIKESGIFAVSVLAQDFPLSLIGHFGFQSGRTVDKFAGISYRLTPGGIPYLPEQTLAFLEAEVTQEVDAGTHTIFIGRLTAAEVLRDGEPMTYAYYQKIKRGAVPPETPAPESLPEKKGGQNMDKYVCTVCGYVYDPAQGDPDNGIAPGTSFADLPEDWVCPICGVGKEDFKKEE